MDDEEILYVDGFEEAFFGYVEIFNKRIALYSRSLCLDILMSQGMNSEEALEFYDFNLKGAYMGEFTPGFFIYKDEL